MLHAAATLYLALSKDPPPESRYAAAAVPRVKHLTIYSGKQPWTGAGEVGEAIMASAADADWDIPRTACPVLDLRRCPDPGGEENLAVLLGRLQRCESPEALKKVSESEEYAPLAGAFAAWISRVLVPDRGVPDAAKSDNLKEVLEMLETKSLTWADRMRAEGRREGRDEGRREVLAGERKLLLRQARIRFGEALAGSLAAPLEGIVDADRLEKIGEWLLVCDSGDARLARLGQH